MVDVRDTKNLSTQPTQNDVTFKQVAPDLKKCHPLNYLKPHPPKFTLLSSQVL